MGELLRAEPGFLKLPGGREEEYLSPVPCPSASPGGPAGQQSVPRGSCGVVCSPGAVLTESQCSPVGIAGAGRCRRCSSRGAWFHGWGWTSAVPSALWNSGRCFCLTAEQRDDNSASATGSSIWQSGCSSSSSCWARLESCGPCKGV